MYDPREVAKKIEPLVSQGSARKYYRLVRGGRWYGGIATADCCGCPLKCIFCWSGLPRDKPEKIGKLYEPNEVFHALISCARKHGYKHVRISGNEPTLCKEHLIKVLELIDKTEFMFILETNGVLIDKNYAKDLSYFKNLHVRVSIKGTNHEEFSILTGAIPDAFDFQIDALKNLYNAHVSCHAAVMISFSKKESFDKLKQIIKKIDYNLESTIEEEYVFLYPHVIERLNKAKIKPIIAYTPNNIPEELI